MNPQDSPHITVIGGAGDMGRHAVRALVRLGTASTIVVADIDGDKARRFSDEVGSPVTAATVDVTDGAAVAELFAGTDVVLNTMGPFARFAMPLMEAAIAAGCDYLDIDDDWQSTQQALSLDERAREAGVRMVIGLGASPGITNLLAQTAAARLDRVDELHTGWSLAAAAVEHEPAFPSKGAAAGEHWIHQCSSPIPVQQDGAETHIDPLERVDLTLPGFGDVYAYTMGHPEPVTLARSYPGLVSSLNLQGIDETSMEELRQLVAAVTDGRLGTTDAVQALESRDPGPQPHMPSLYALAVGEHEGRRRSVLAHLTQELPGRMGGATGIPLAVGAELLRRGAVARPGVHPPETAVAARDFFELLTTFLPSGSDPVEVITD